MEMEKYDLEGLFLLRPRVFNDPRGMFFEGYNEKRFLELGLNTDWKQDNHASSSRNVLRGLHFQRGKGQDKLICCVKGRIWDVAVDIRKNSPTLGQWRGLELSEDNYRMFYISAGFAHGYVVLSETARVIYKCSTMYDAAIEDEIKWDDPEISVEWPLTDPIISERDRNAQSFRQYVNSE